MGIITSVGYVAVSNSKTNADSSKLSSDVASINQSVLLYQSSGVLTPANDLSRLTAVDDVLAQLKTKGSSSILGVTSSTLDARVYAVYQTSAEAATSSPRAVWVASERRFQVKTSGAAGVKKFLLNEDLASSAPTTDTTRTSLKTASTGNGWVWDRADPTSVQQVASVAPQTGVVDTGANVMSNLGLNTGSWTVGPSGQVTFNYGYREAGYQSRLALFSLDGMDIYDLTTDAGRKAFMLEAMRRILAGGTQGQVVIDASKATPGITTNTFNFKPGDQVAALLIPNTDLQTAMNNLANSNTTLAAYAQSNPSQTPLVSPATYGSDIPEFYSRQYAMIGNSNTYAVEDMPAVLTGSAADYQDMVFTTAGLSANGQVNNLLVDPATGLHRLNANGTLMTVADYYTTGPAHIADGSSWNLDSVSNNSTESLRTYLNSVDPNLLNSSAVPPTTP